MPENKKLYTPTIGLEVHAELATRTKMFCGCKNDPDEKRPNINICPVCMAHPGTLPVVNKEAVRSVLRVGVALGSALADFTEFDRKNYFYPDIPKGYQISQYLFPLVSGGSLNGVAITRVHLEEDTARSSHPEARGVEKEEGTLVDFNRAGVPLMELVTEPVVHTAEEASAFARELQLLLRTLGVSEANMEKGEMRVEANISIAPINADDRGSRINADKSELLYEDLSYKIRGAAFAVYNALGSGHKESVYQNALAQHLEKVGVVHTKEKHIPVTYENKKVGSYQPDFVIEDKIIVEIKALPFVGKIEKEQVQYYLKNSSYRLAMIINFGASPIYIERVVYDTIRDNLPSHPRQSAPLGTKVEVKNLNSFRSVERAIAYEIERQEKLLDCGEAVVQETRGWDESRGTTFSQRKKESAHDYRYFPDPDIPKFKLREMKEFSLETLQKSMPELPWEKRARLVKEFGVKEENARIFVENSFLAELFERTAGIVSDSRGYALAENYITSDIAGLIKGGETVGKITPEYFADLIKMLLTSSVSSRGAKDILAEMYMSGKAPEKIAEEKNLIQKSDLGELKIVAKKIVDDNVGVVAEYRAGKESVLQFLVGQGMKETKGSANPELLRQAIVEMVGS